MVGNLVEKGFADGRLVVGDDVDKVGRMVGTLDDLIGIKDGALVGTNWTNGSLRMKSGRIETVPAFEAMPALIITDPEPAGGMIKVAKDVLRSMPLYCTLFPKVDAATRLLDPPAAHRAPWTKFAAPNIRMNSV